MGLLDCPEEIFKHIFAYLIKPAKEVSISSCYDHPETHNPFYESIEASLPLFLQCRLVSKEFQNKIDQLNPNRFVSLLPSLRKTMLNFTDPAAIREPKTSSIFGTFVRWVNVQELRAVVPLMINKIFKTDADKNIAKNIFNSAVYLQLGPANQTIAMPIPNNNNSYAVIQSFFSYQGDIHMSNAIVGGICEYENKKAPGEIRTNKEIFDDFSKNFEEYIKKHDIIALNNGRMVNGVFQVSKKTINTLVTALEAPQWSVHHEYGDEIDPVEHQYCFVRLILSMLNYHQLAIEYTNNEIEVSLSGGPLFGVYNDNTFCIVDDRIEEILPSGKNPSLAQLTHELKNMIAAHKVTFDSFERAALYHSQLRNALMAFWMMNIMRVKNRKRYLDVQKTLEKIVPQFTLEKYTDLFEKKIEWFKFQQTFAELYLIIRPVYGRWNSFGYSITFNSSQMVIFKIDTFEGLYSYNSIVVRGVGIKSLENKKNETVILMTDIDRENKKFDTILPHSDVIQELKSLMEFPETLSDVDTLNFFAALAVQYAKIEVAWFDYVSPRSTETYFLSSSLDDSDSEYDSDSMETDDG
jgi:hypothetical protein